MVTGGIYNNNPSVPECRCCETPPCEFFFEYKTRYWGWGKCGYFEYDDDGNVAAVWRQKTIKVDDDYSSNSGCGYPNSGTASGSLHTTEVRRSVRTDENDPSRESGGLCFGGEILVSREGTSTRDRVCIGFDGVLSFESHCSSELDMQGQWFGTATVTEQTLPPWHPNYPSYETTTTQRQEPCDYIYSPAIITYQDEYTTDDLIGESNDREPEYREEWNRANNIWPRLNGALWVLDAGETILIRIKTLWRICHPPTGTCYLKVWLKKVFEPWITFENPNPEPIEEDIEPYEWSGSGNPCIANDQKIYNHEDNLIRGEASEIDTSSRQNGYYGILVKKWSCVRGYEPDPDNGKPNGYPEP